MSSLNTLGRQALAQALRAATINFEDYLAKVNRVSGGIASLFSKQVAVIEQQAGPDEYGEYGGCWLWFSDGTSTLVRSLIRCRRAFVTTEGRYLAHLYEFSDGRSLRQRELMTQKLAQAINTLFGVECCYFSVLNSGDPEELPTYADMCSEDFAFFNDSSNYA